MKPVIGVACNLELYNDREKTSSNKHYLDGIIIGGGFPVILPYTEDNSIMETALSVINGLLLPGGADIYPRIYNADSLPGLEYVNPRLDIYQSNIARRALQRQMPILGICRGMQLLNVIFGGTLIQHIPPREPWLQHRQGIAPRWTCHSVIAEPKSLIETLLGGKFEVNSLHHQAIDHIAPEMKATAFASDGIVEAIEHSKFQHIWGVQWHPEELICDSNIMKPIFEHFVSTCKQYQVSK